MIIRYRCWYCGCPIGDNLSTFRESLMDTIERAQLNNSTSISISCIPCTRKFYEQGESKCV